MSPPRPLTDAEHRLVRWMLEHGQASADAYLAQLDRAAVIWQCSCGCATFHFKVGDHPADFGSGREIISDWIIWDGDEPVGGIFVYLQDGMLSGLETHTWLDTYPRLPSPDMLMSVEEANRRIAERVGRADG